MIPAHEHPQILISCYYKKSVNGEDIVNRHAFAYQITGSLTVQDGREKVIFQPGDFRFNVRNRLAKFVKQPGESDPFKSLSLQFLLTDCLQNPVSTNLEVILDPQAVD